MVDSKPRERVMVNEVKLPRGWFQADLNSAAQRLRDWNGYDFNPQKSFQKGVPTQPVPTQSGPAKQEPKPAK